MSLEEVLQLVEAKESVKRSTGQLLQSQGAETIRSQYRKQNTSQRPPNRSYEACYYWGKKQATATKRHPNNASKSAQHLVLSATSVVDQTTLRPPLRVKTSPSTEEPYSQQAGRQKVQSSMLCAT